jgi:hypothetical protein
MNKGARALAADNYKQEIAKEAKERLTLTGGKPAMLQPTNLT